MIHLVAAGLLIALASFAAEPPAGGVPLLSSDLAALRLGGRAAADAEVRPVPAAHAAFSNALRVATLRKPPYPWNITLAAPTLGPLRKGDAVLATVWARRIESRQETGEAQLEVIVEESAGEHRKLMEAAASVGTNWTRLDAPFAPDRDLPAGAAQLSLRFGYAPQVIEIAGVSLRNHGTSVPLARLPRTRLRYDGWEADAPWRRAAAERIERLRKGDLRIAVTDAAGRPVAGVPVRVRMLRHAFAFGSAVSAEWIATPGGPDHERYRSTITACFNKVVFENNLKWDAWRTDRPGGPEHRERTMRALAWLEERGIAVRGHVMVWPSWHTVPAYVGKLRDDPAALRRAVDDHIADQTSALRGRLAEWDVVNESYAHHDLLDVLGRGEMIRWFQLARQGDPGVRLFYNDYIMFAGEGPGSPSRYFHDTIRFLQEGGAPIGGIGEQGHFGGNPPSPESILRTFDRFAAFGLPIQISEFDIDTSDAELQVAFTRDFLTACFSHPALNGVMCWGFWEGRHWKPRAALWAKDWTLRPHGKVWLDLVRRAWWTDVEARTGADGRCTLRGFCGDYEVVAGSVTNRVALPREGADAALRFR